MADMRMQLILGLREKVLGPLKSIQGGSQEAAQALKSTRDQLRDLDKAQQDLGGLRNTRIQLRGQQRDLQELQGKLGGYNASLQAQRERHQQTTASLKTARESHARLTRALQDGATATPEFTRQLEMARVTLLSSQGAYERSNGSISKYRGQIKSTQSDIAQLTGKITGGKERLQGYERRLQDAGIGTDRLGLKSRSLKTQIDAATAAVDKQKQSLAALKAQQERVGALKAQHAKTMLHTGMAAGTGVAMVAAGRRGVDAGMAPVRNFAEHQDHMLGIARQIEGARDAGGSLTPVYYAIEEQIRGLSQRIPMATTAITDMVTAAARMEVPTDKLAEFTLMASEIATAFDAVPDQITESMGKVAKNFKIPLTDIRGLADSINYLDDNAISKGADIIDFLNRTSGVVSTVAMSAKDAAALGSTLLTLGERAETASTAANAIVQKFAAASKGTKKFQSALKEINLSPDAVQQGMAKDATATLLEVVNSIRKLPDSQRIGVMVELVGMEHSDTLAKLVDKPEELQRQIGLANGEGAEGSMAREASARNSTLSAQWQMSKNRAFNLSAALGASLEPALLGLLNAVNPLLEGFSQFVKENQSLVKGVLGSFVAFSALLAGLGALLIPLALLSGKVMLLRFGFGMLGIKMPGMIAGIRARASALGPGLQGAAAGAARAVPAALARIGLAMQAPVRGASPLLQGFKNRIKAPTAGLPKPQGAAFKAIPEKGKAVWNSFTATIGRIPEAAATAGKSVQGAFGRARMAIAAATARLWAYLAAQKAAAAASARRGVATVATYAVMRGPTGMAKDAMGGMAGLARSGIAGVLGGIRAAFLGVGQAIMLVGRALLLNPMGLAIAAMAVGALLILKYWQPIKAFFSGMWTGFTNGLAPLAPMFSAVFGTLGNALAPLRPLWNGLIGTFAAVWGWVSRLFGPFQATQQSLVGATQAGHGFGAWLASLVVTAAELVGKFYNVGRDIVTGLINGISSMVGAVGETVSSLAGSTIGWFKEKLGIHSPSRVFMAAGVNVGEGAALGIGSTSDMVRKSAAIMAAAAAVSLPAPAVSMPTLPEPPAIQATQVVPPIQAMKGGPLTLGALPLLGLPVMPGASVNQRMLGMPAVNAEPAGLLADQAGAIRIDQRPPLAAQAATRPAPVIQGDTITLQIHAAPGMDEQAIARLVSAELERRDRAKAARAQAAFYDWNS